MFSTGQLMGGTFDEVPARNAELSTLLAAGKVRRGANRHMHAVGSWGTGCGFRAQPDLRTFSGCRNGKRGRYRPYFENYTVDASILETMRKHRFTNEW